MRKKLFSLLLAAATTLSLLTVPAAALDLEEAKQLLQDHYVDTLPPAALEAETMEELLAALNDPYTVHLSEEEYQSFLTSVNGDSVIGIGVSVQKAFTDGFPIMSVLPDSPALEAGLEAGDRIVAVDGVTLTDGSDITAALGGEEGTPVSVTIIRGSDGKRVTLSMERRRVAIPIVTYELVDGIGYIDCTSFGDTTSEVVQEALQELDDQVSVWVMDLRSNPGGTASAASAAAGFFQGQAIMAHMRDAAGNDTYYHTPGWPDLTDKPLIVLVSPYSASGSELFTAAARDHAFGLSIGQRTYGKGVAQIILDEENTEGLFSGDGLKLTAYRFYSPNGTTNHIVGILPTLLISPENTAAAAVLLSSSPEAMAEGRLKLELAGQTLYVDLLKARQPEFKAPFLELLEALPPSAKLYRGANYSTWRPTTPAEVAASLSLPYQPRTFSDIGGIRFQREVETLATYRLLSGYEDGTFRPDNAITRAEFCTMITAALNLPQNPAALTFSDTPADAWYAPYVSAMAARGFVSGYEDGTFRPNATITYQEMATILSAVGCWANTGLADLNQKDIPIKDWNLYSHFDQWAQRPARNLDSVGALVGGQAPGENGTRQVAAGMLCSLLEGIGLLWDGE